MEAAPLSLCCRLQTSEANSKLNTFLFTVVACKDSHGNLVKRSYKTPYKDLQKTQWQGNKIRVFLFGDYDFLLNISLWFVRGKSRAPMSLVHIVKAAGP